MDLGSFQWLIDEVFSPAILIGEKLAAAPPGAVDLVSAGLGAAICSRHCGTGCTMCTHGRRHEKAFGKSDGFPAM
jgi:hypothetical protein